MEAEDFDDVEERVHEVMTQVVSGSGERDVRIEERQMDVDERTAVTAFIQSTCGCKKGLGSKPCVSQFSADHLQSVRASCFELTRSELDMVVMGQLMAGMNDEKTTNTASGHRGKDRQRASCSFHHQGKPICEKTFKFLHTLGGTRYRNLKKSLQSQGLATRTHGNLKRSPAHALTLSSTEFVVRFLLNYAEQNALLLPGRVPGYSRSDLKLLPSSVSKRQIWKVYEEAAMSDSMRSVGYSTFTSLWRSLLPSVILMKPMTDLCWQCQKGSTAIQRSANLSEEEKSAAVLSVQEHLRVVQVERSFYTASCEECSRSVRAHFQNQASFSPPPPSSHIPPNTNPIKAHYSFDYAQQVCPTIQERLLILSKKLKSNLFVS